MALRHAKFSIHDAGAVLGAETAISSCRHTQEQALVITTKASTVGDGTIDIQKNGATILAAPLVPALTPTVYKGKSLAAILAVSPTMFELGDVIEIIIAGTTGADVGATLRNHITRDEF